MAEKILRGKRMKAVWEGLDESVQPIDGAIATIKSRAKAKFDETVEVIFNLGIDPALSEQGVRGVVAMPNGTGKTTRVAVIAKGDNVEKAQKAGADIVGADELIEQIQKGIINFDTCIATPDMMALIGKVAKVLGPKGLMPNPKLGTVTTDVVGAIKKAKAGQVEFRSDKGGIVHAGVGKASFGQAQLKENIRALYDALIQARPSGLKGAYIQHAHISSTMGPSVKFDVQTLAA